MLGTQQIFFGLILFISLNAIQGQRLKQCAGMNEYCLTHADCCSNTCLTFLYRCTQSYDGIYPYTFFGESNPPAGTINDVLEFTFGNSGSVAEMQNRRRQQQQQQEQINQVGYQNVPRFYGRYKRQTVDTTTANDNVITAESSQTSDTVAAECKAIGLKCFNNDECCSKRCHGFLHQCVT